MRIDGLSQQPKVTQTQPRNTPVRAKKDSEAPGDVVEISLGTLDIAELSAQARAVRTENNPRLQEIRQRVEEGFYNSRQVRQQIADSLLTADSMREVVADIAQVQVAREELAKVPDTREEQVQVARQRVESGFYDSPQVRRETADRILDELA